MLAATLAIVVPGVVLTTVVGLALGLDLRGSLTLAGIVGVGAMAIAAARKTRAGAVAPARCQSCDGLISPNDRGCKHCGEAW